MGDKRQSLLIGVNSYRPTIGQLTYCVSDVLHIEKALNSRREGFNSTESILLTDEQTDELRPTRTNIIDNIVRMCDAATTEDTFILHFSGHGMIGKDGNCYLLPLDASAASLVETAIPWDWIRNKVDTSRAQRKILIIDACHSGAGRDPLTSVQRSDKVIEELSRSTEGFVCIASCSGGQLSYESPELKQGIFSHFLVDGILGAADPLGQGIIEVENLFKYVRERTQRYAGKLGVNQEPYLIGKVTAPLNTYIISAVALERPINQVLVLTENPFLGRLLETGIRIASLARDATWTKDIEFALSEAKARFDYDAVYIDVENDWKRKKEFILLSRERYPIVPFVLVGSRDNFLETLSKTDRSRFRDFFFFDVATSISQTPDLILDTLGMVEWDIRTRYGELKF